jgi:hypothetical protein
MPMLTTSVMRRPSKPSTAAANRRDEFLQPAQTSLTPGMTSRPSTDRAVAAVAERDVEARRPSVDALARNRRSIQAGSSASSTSASRSESVRVVTRFFE